MSDASRSFAAASWPSSRLRASPAPGARAAELAAAAAAAACCASSTSASRRTACARGHGSGGAASAAFRLFDGRSRRDRRGASTRQGPDAFATNQRDQRADVDQSDGPTRQHRPVRRAAAARALTGVALLLHQLHQRPHRRRTRAAAAAAAAARRVLRAQHPLALLQLGVRLARQLAATVRGRRRGAAERVCGALLPWGFQRSGSDTQGPVKNEEPLRPETSKGVFVPGRSANRRDAPAAGGAASGGAWYLERGEVRRLRLRARRGRLRARARRRLLRLRLRQGGLDRRRRCQRLQHPALLLTKPSPTNQSPLVGSTNLLAPVKQATITRGCRRGGRGAPASCGHAPPPPAPAPLRAPPWRARPPPPPPPPPSWPRPPPPPPPAPPPPAPPPAARAGRRRPRPAPPAPPPPPPPPPPATAAPAPAGAPPP
eukprot:107508-Prorocentrum_minimum.AAC.1